MDVYKIMCGHRLIEAILMPQAGDPNHLWMRVVEIVSVIDYDRGIFRVRRIDNPNGPANYSNIIHLFETEDDAKAAYK